jgi:salicylate hydroxylase
MGMCGQDQRVLVRMLYAGAVRALSLLPVGGGIGGLTAGLALLAADLDVRVYEQARTVADVGAGIQLAPNATRVLDQLGVLPAVERLAVAPSRFEFRRWDDGRLLSQTPLGPAIADRYGAPYLHVHRGDLVKLLAAALPADRLEIGRRVTAVSAGVAESELRFADGTTVVAEIVVGADGIHSSVREAVLGPDQPRFTGHVAYRGLVPANRVDHLELERTCVVWLGPGAHFVHYFIGGGKLLNVVCIAEEDAWTRESWTDTGDADEVRAAFAGWHPVVIDIIDALDQPLKWALFDRLPLPRWSDGTVTLLGDACHPMLPYGAQGAAQAIEDAAVLAACLREAPHDAIATLATYESLRRPRTSRVQAISRGNAERFHLPDGPKQVARDAAMASSFGISPDVDWLYGHDIMTADATDAA